MSLENYERKPTQLWAEYEGFVQGLLEANPGHYPLGIEAQDHLDRLQSTILQEIKDIKTEDPRFFELARLLGKITAINVLSRDKGLEG
jgi:hypothetical protein